MYFNTKSYLKNIHNHTTKHVVTTWCMSGEPNLPNKLVVSMSRLSAIFSDLLA
jgi:hypothetical protein